MVEYLFWGFVLFPVWGSALALIWTVLVIVGVWLAEAYQRHQQIRAMEALAKLEAARRQPAKWGGDLTARSMTPESSS